MKALILSFLALIFLTTAVYCLDTEDDTGPTKDQIKDMYKVYKLNVEKERLAKEKDHNQYQRGILSSFIVVTIFAVYFCLEGICYICCGY